MKKKKQPSEEMLVSDSSHDEDQPAVQAKRSKPGVPSEEVVYHPVKLSRNDLYRPPSAEELNQLKEAESLFHCSLLKMQMEELLKEVVLSERRRQQIDSFIANVTEHLQTVPTSPKVEVSDLSWLSGSVKVPFLLMPKATKGKFYMTPPASVNLIGSYPLGTCIKPHIRVDLAVTIPAEVLQEKDFLNQRYPRKRALYLAGLAQHLSSSSEVGTLRYSCLHGNRLRPVLVLTPPGKDSSSFTVRLHACPPPGFFKPNRFHPQRNNVRTEWYTGVQTAQPESSDPPTPHYNSSVLGDLLPRAHLQFLSAVSSQCSAFTDGVALLKVWLHQRQLDQGTGCFSGFHASMLVAYLLTTHRVSNNMTAYQLLRNSLNFLASTDLTVNGISLAKNPDSTAPSLAEFHSAFQVVFVDPSGHLNMCSDMTACTYKQLQHEASLSMQFWDEPTVDGFHCLLMTPKPMIRTSDHVFQLCDLVKLQSTCKKQNLLNDLMDLSGNYVQAALPFILSLLQQGLGQRIHQLTHSLAPDPEWSVEGEAPKYKAQPPLSFGLLLKPELAASVLEKGPAADNPKAVEFRQLWGSRSELRRFQDGSITEAVLWEGESMCQKRLVPQQIVTYLLQLHADIPEASVRHVGGMDDVVKTGSEVPTTGEEESLAVVQAYDDLSRKLWNLEGLPLSITAVQGAHPALRYTQVFPPQPLKVDYTFFDKEKTSRSLIPKEGKPCPAYITPITVICHMEGSGKWPHDRLAIRHIRSAFHIRLAELLKKQHNYTCRACPSHLDVWKDGLAFRIQVAYHREPQVLRESVTPEGLLVVRDNEEAQQLEMATIHKPLLTSTLHGLQQEYSCFGAVCRLAKRWLAAQLFADDITEDTADLLVASLFLQPAPFTPPGSPQVGFLRFLHLLSSFEWRNNPLIVNLNNQLTAADYTEIKNSFMASRVSPNSATLHILQGSQKSTNQDTTYREATHLTPDNDPNKAEVTKLEEPSFGSERQAIETGKRGDESGNGKRVHSRTRLSPTFAERFPWLASRYPGRFDSKSRGSLPRQSSRAPLTRVSSSVGAGRPLLTGTPTRLSGAAGPSIQETKEDLRISPAQDTLSNTAGSSLVQSNQNVASDTRKPLISVSPSASDSDSHHFLSGKRPSSEHTNIKEKLENHLLVRSGEDGNDLAESYKDSTITSISERNANNRDNVGRTEALSRTKPSLSSRVIQSPRRPGVGMTGNGRSSHLNTRQFGGSRLPIRPHAAQNSRLDASSPESVDFSSSNIPLPDLTSDRNVGGSATVTKTGGLMEDNSQTSSRDSSRNHGSRRRYPVIRGKPNGGNGRNGRLNLTASNEKDSLTSLGSSKIPSQKFITGPDGTKWMIDFERGFLMNQDGQVLQDSQGRPKRVVLGEDGRTIFDHMGSPLLNQEGLALFGHGRDSQPVVNPKNKLLMVGGKPVLGLDVFHPKSFSTITTTTARPTTQEPTTTEWSSEEFSTTLPFPTCPPGTFSKTDEFGYPLLDQEGILDCYPEEDASGMETDDLLSVSMVPDALALEKDELLVKTTSVPTTTRTTTEIPTPEPKRPMNRGPSSAFDLSGKERFTAPYVNYIRKDPGAPCSLTEALEFLQVDVLADLMKKDHQAASQKEPPRHKPHNLTVVAMEGCHSFIILDWARPLKGDMVSGYMVYSASYDDVLKNKWSSRLSNGTHLPVENLKPNSRYYFKVQAKNVFGLGPVSETLTYVTESDDPLLIERPPGGEPIWIPFTFKYNPAHSSCKGSQYVKRTWYRKFVGVVLCNSLRYKIFMGDGLRDLFHSIGDTVGQGEDHCQFVDSYRDGRTGPISYHLPSAQGYYRAYRQEPVKFGAIGPRSPHSIVGWYECGVPIPGKW